MNDKAVLKAVEYIRNCPFKGTAVKVELEAQLDRDDDWGDEDYCQRDILKRLHSIGLSDANGRRRSPLTYAEFYNDGSVDSEFTFTLLLDKPENIFLLPKIIDAWNDFCHEVTDDVDIRGAGMHIAILQDPQGIYPRAISDEQYIHFNNFQKSNTLLLPALYFLATHDHISRSLEFRKPAIRATNDAHGYGKFNAIIYKGQALEYRIFDTCYDRPLAILDNIVVIANTLKYWTPEYTNPGIDKITKRITFGNDSSNRLERFYTTVTHIDLLNEGLRLLKPSYRSIRELREERGFKLNKRQFAHLERRLAREAEVEYREYEERFEWSLYASRYTYQGEYLAQADRSKPVPTLQQEAQAYADTIIAQKQQKKLELATFVRDKLDRAMARQQGQFTLTA